MDARHLLLHILAATRQQNVKIADSEEDGEDPGNQDLEQMLHLLQVLV